MGQRKTRAWTGFVPVIASHELRRAPVRVTFDETALALFRDHTGRAAAVLDRCPHRFAPLSAGTVRPDGRLACGYHGWNFDRDGHGKSPSEPERTDCDTIAFRVVEAGGIIFIAPPGTRSAEPTKGLEPEGEWVTRPSESRLHGLGIGKPRAGEVRLDRLAPALAGSPRYRPFRVAKRETETDAITSFTFVPEGDHEVVPFRAGQHIIVRLRPQGRVLTRSYSLSDAPNGESFRISVKRIDGEPAGVVSTHVHDTLRVGERVELTDPAGDFCLPEEDRPLVLVAGGVGITPLFAMLKTALRTGRTAPITLLYGVRTPAEIYRREEIAALARAANVRVRFFVSGPDAAGHERGRIDAAALATELAGEPDLFVCGPDAMIDDVARAASLHGLPPQRVHFERFRSTLGAHVAALPACDVTFARTKRVLRWTPNEGSLLDLAHKHGIELDSGCRVGSCGTCRLSVASGETVASGTTREARGASGCLVCIAVPRGDLVLDA